MPDVLVFRGRDGLRIALVAEAVTSVIELDDGCQVVTKDDTHVVAGSWPEVAGLVWPDVLGR